jgi:hypothetical protein
MKEQVNLVEPPPHALNGFGGRSFAPKITILTTIHWAGKGVYDDVVNHLCQYGKEFEDGDHNFVWCRM